MRDELLATICDELSTRLATLMLTVDVLTSGERADKAALVRLIERQVRRLGSINASPPAGQPGRRPPHPGRLTAWLPAPPPSPG